MSQWRHLVRKLATGLLHQVKSIIVPIQIKRIIKIREGSERNILVSKREKMYKCVMVNLMVGVTLLWSSITHMENSAFGTPCHCLVTGERERSKQSSLAQHLGPIARWVGLDLAHRGAIVRFLWKGCVWVSFVDLPKLPVHWVSVRRRVRVRLFMQWLFLWQVSVWWVSVRNVRWVSVR